MMFCFAFLNDQNYIIFIPTQTLLEQKGFVESLQSTFTLQPKKIMKNIFVKQI